MISIKRGCQPQEVFISFIMFQSASKSHCILLLFCSNLFGCIYNFMWQLHLYDGLLFLQLNWNLNVTAVLTLASTTVQFDSSVSYTHMDIIILFLQYIVNVKMTVYKNQIYRNTVIRYK